MMRKKNMILVHAQDILSCKRNIVGFLLLFVLLICVPISVFSASTAVVSIYFTGQIGSAPLIGTSIGQYSNGTYYAANSISGKTYAIDPYYASKLINNAITIANAHSGGGTVTIGSGTFLLNATIVPQSDVYLKVDPSATIYENTPASLGQSFSLLFTAAQVNNFTLDGGTLNANKGSLTDNRGTGTWSYYFFNYFGVGIYSDIPNNAITIKNVVVENAIGRGVSLFNPTNSLIQNVTTINSGDNPITIEGNNPNFQSNSIIENSLNIGGQDVGINTWEIANVTIQNNVSVNVTQNAGSSHWGIAAEVSNNINIINNTALGCDEGIVSTSNNTLISNNIVNGLSNNGGVGIQIEYSNSTIVTRNNVTNYYYPLSVYGGAFGGSQGDVQNLQVRDNTMSGSMFVISGLDTILANNTFTATGGNGVSIENANNITITGNVFLGNYGLLDYSTVIPSLTSNAVYISYNDFSALTATRVYLPNCVNVTYLNNIGYP